MSENAGTDNLGEKAAAGESQPLPDRAQEHRVDVPQNETAAPVEAAQATDAALTEAPTTEVTETRTEQTQITETPAQSTESATTEGESNNN